MTDNIEQPVGFLLSLAYPDRIGQRIPEERTRYRLSSGRGVQLTPSDPLATEEYIVIPELDGSTPWANSFLAAPISIQDLKAFSSHLIQDIDFVLWDDGQHKVLAQKERRLGELILDTRPIRTPDSSLILSALLSGIREKGIECLRWTPELRQWQARVKFLEGVEEGKTDWPDLSNATLLQRLDEWLGPFIQGITRLDQVQRIDLTRPLQSLLSWHLQKRLDHLAPTHLVVPSGSRIRLDYTIGEVPVLAVRLQEMFGCQNTPCIADGQIPVILHLLSPARRPVQVTQHLASFWKSAYQEVKKDLRGRYPKHHWPDDPLATPPTRRTKTKP